jgi:hypothetical protein
LVARFVSFFGFSFIKIKGDKKTELRDAELMFNRYFSAVAGDAPSWECWPPGKWALVCPLVSYCSATSRSFELTMWKHEFLLGSWGMLIGEMFDLEVRRRQGSSILQNSNLGISRRLRISVKRSSGGRSFSLVRRSMFLVSSFSF